MFCGNILSVRSSMQAIERHITFRKSWVTPMTREYMGGWPDRRQASKHIRKYSYRKTGKQTGRHTQPKVVYSTVEHYIDDRQENKQKSKNTFYVSHWPRNSSPAISSSSVFSFTTSSASPSAASTFTISLSPPPTGHHVICDIIHVIYMLLIKS